MKRQWTNQELETLRSYYGKILTKNMVDYLPNRSVNAIGLKAREIGLKGEPSVTRRTIDVDLAFFHVPNPRKSYWAGFIAADGNVKRNKNLIRIKLSKKDEQHLLQFKNDCAFSGSIKEAIKNKDSYAPHKKSSVIRNKFKTMGDRSQKQLQHNTCKKSNSGTASKS